MQIHNCPNCLQGSMKAFYEIGPVPVHSVALVRTFHQAVTFPASRIALAVCDRCGFIGNTAFDESKMHYSPDCEETQGFSSTFSAFHSRLASDLITRFGLHNKTILEIGCGKGEFISLICAMGSNRGIGFDPAFDPRRIPAEGGDAVTFYQEFYSERSRHSNADFIACKMTLEHIPNPFEFVGTIRRAIGNSEPTVFFQVPDMKRVLTDIAFWDVYHEHCSYFTDASLRNLFTLCGFEVLETWRDYDDQYLMITAIPVPERSTSQIRQPSHSDLERVWTFAEEASRRADFWKRTLEDASRIGKKVVLWGSGSKAVSFLSSVGESGTAAVRYVVDINPFRQTCFMPGTGQQIVSPQFLDEYKPEVVIAMNSIYIPEIESDLRNLGLLPTLLPIEAGEISPVAS
jgi:Methyltransferase domain/C-methyltransferase C-terminal domain